MSKASLLCLVFGICALPLREARASCKWVPPPSPVPAFPADGATGVPVNASLWVMTRGGGSAVEIDGAEASMAESFIGWERWALTGLEPGETITWSLTLTGDEPHTFGPYTFQVGDATAAAPATPALDHAEAVPEDAAGSLCDKAMQMTDCIDTGPNTYVRVHVEPQGGVVLYGICDEGPDGPPCKPRHIIRSSCPATTFIHEGQQARCFRVTAYNQALGSAPLVTCLEPEEPGGADPDAAADEQAGDGGGCRTTTRAPAWAALALLLALAYRGRRPRRGFSP